MNAARLRSIVDFLLAKEAELTLQGKLTALHTAVGDLVSAPQDATQQKRSGDALKALQTAVNGLTQNLSPSDLINIEEVRALPYFGPHMADVLSTSFLENGMTPAVFLQEVQTLTTAREAYLKHLQVMRTSMAALGVEQLAIAPGHAEIGVLLPRRLFENSLDGFQEELRILNRTIRTFYEISNVTPEPIELKDISTTDPIIFLGIDVTVLVHMGHTIKWCIEVIKGTAEIVKVAKAAKASGVDDKIVEQIEQQVQISLDKQIEKKVADELAKYTGEAARRNELEKPMNDALAVILDRVQRGMTVEIRFLPPPTAGDTTDKAAAAKQQEFAELAEIAKSLEFPKISQAAVSQISSSAGS